MEADRRLIDTASLQLFAEHVLRSSLVLLDIAPTLVKSRRLVGFSRRDYQSELCDPIVVRRKRSTAGGSHASRHEIALHDRHHTRTTLIHELAHVIVLRCLPSGVVAGHGREWAWTYLQLVRGLLGADSYKTLRRSFLDNRVKCTKPSPWGRPRRAPSQKALEALAEFRKSRQQ